MQKLIVEYEGKLIDTSKIGLCIKERPNIVTSELDVETIEVQGRHGALHIENSYKDRIFSIELNILDSNLLINLSEIKEILLDSTKLLFSDNLKYIYIVKAVEIGDIENEIKEYGSFIVEFTVDPFNYTRRGQEMLPLTSDEINIGGYISRPLLKLNLSGGSAILQINDNRIVLKEVPTPVFIDFENGLCYSENPMTNLLEKMEGDAIMELRRGKHSIKNISGINSIEIMTREGWR